jgi:hypothetical protein
MVEVTPYLFGISLEVRLRKPRSFSQQRLDALLLRLIDSENGLALRSDQIRLRQHDFAFDYEVRASLLAGNGLLIHDAEKFFLSVSGGRTEADALLLAETAKRFLWSSEVSSEDVGLFYVNTHAKTDAKEKRDQFLRGFAADPRITGPGALGYVHVAEWTEDVRFSLEPSLGVPDSLFFAWNTQFRGISAFQSIEGLTRMLASVAVVFGIEFKPFTK